MPEDFRQARTPSWGTESKDMARSKKTAETEFPLSSDRCQSLVAYRRAERWGLNPK